MPEIILVVSTLIITWHFSTTVTLCSWLSRTILILIKRLNSYSLKKRSQQRLTQGVGCWQTERGKNRNMLLRHLPMFAWQQTKIGFFDQQNI